MLAPTSGGRAAAPTAASIALPAARRRDRAPSLQIRRAQAAFRADVVRRGLLVGARLPPRVGLRAAPRPTPSRSGIPGRPVDADADGGGVGVSALPQSRRRAVGGRRRRGGRMSSRGELWQVDAFRAAARGRHRTRKSRPQACRAHTTGDARVARRQRASSTRWRGRPRLRRGARTGSIGARAAADRTAIGRTCTVQPRTSVHSVTRRAVNGQRARRARVRARGSMARISACRGDHRARAP